MNILVVGVILSLLSIIYGVTVLVISKNEVDGVSIISFSVTMLTIFAAFLFIIFIISGPHPNEVLGRYKNTGEINHEKIEAMIWNRENSFITCVYGDIEILYKLREIGGEEE